jgi:GTP cyclohydrolase I
MRDAYLDILREIGEDPGRDGLQDTPLRAAKAMSDLTAGYAMDPAKILARTFAVHYDEMVVVARIPFFSLCEHHLLPFHGYASVGYVPTGRVVGLSKIPRAVFALSRRLQVQERLTEQIADAMVAALEPKGVGVYVRARHLCMEMRGVQVASETATQALRGVMLDGPARAEFLALARG